MAAASAVGSASTEIAILNALENSSNPPVELLEHAFTEYFQGDKFNKTLFHYLLTRLGKAKSNIAIDYSIVALKTHPEETGAILRYLGTVGIEQVQIQKLGTFFSSPDCIYDYQKYIFVKWCETQRELPNELLTIIRGWAFDGSLPQWIRSFSISVLGSNGSGHDFEIVEAQYDTQPNDVLKADCIYACRNQEKGRRNAFYAKAAYDGFLISKAIDASKKSI